MITGSVETGFFEHAHEDNRRIILECNLSTSSVQFFTINEAIPLGNHFHKERHETFVIVTGEGICSYLTLTKNGEPCGEQITLEVRPGSVVQIHPFTAHVFRLKPGSTMLCFSSIPFDPDHNDMFAFELKIP